MADLDLARRAVAATGWRWMPGMAWYRDFAGGQSLGDRSGRILTDWDAVDDGGRVFRIGVLDLLPDLDDPATQGCLLALVREALGTWVHVEQVGDDCWFAWAGKLSRDEPSRLAGVGDTESAALVAALEVERG